jgi:PAS domain S-box-containing protein
MTEDPTGRGTPGVPPWSDALYRNLVERVPVVVYIDSDEQRPDSLYVSPQVEALFGHPPQAYLADPELWRRQTEPEDHELIREGWRVARETGVPFECEYRLNRPDGRVVWVRDSAVPVVEDDGRIRFWQGVVTDITTAKDAELAMRRSAAEYRALVENLPAVIYRVARDDDRRTMYVSPHVETALGYSRKEWLEQPDIWMELLHPDDRETTLAAFDLHNETGRPWSREYRLIASDGHAVWFRDVAHLMRSEDGRRLSWHGVQLDITELKVVEDELRAAHTLLEARVAERTAELEEANALMSLEIGERRRAEDELRAAENRYRALAEQIPAVTYVWEVGLPRGVAPQPYTSPRIEQLLGYTLAEWEATPGFALTRLHPDDRPDVEVAMLHAETTGEPLSIEYRYLHKDGHIVWVVDQAILLSRHPDGRPHLFQGVVLDITARKQAEAKAHETELRYRDLAEQMPAVTYILDLRPGADGDETVYLSPQVTDMFGFDPSRWGDTERWLATVHPEDRERVAQSSSRIDEDGEPYVMEYRIIAKDGTTRWVRDQARLLSRDALGRPKEIQGLVIEITDARRSERDRREAEQLYRTLVEQLPAITYIERPGSEPDETRLVYLSPQAELLVGYTTQELIEDPGHFGRMLHPEDRERVFTENAHSEATGEPFDSEYRVIARDGRVVWLHSRAVLVRDEDGSPRFWHGLSLDVTAHRELESRYRELAGRVFRELGIQAE